MVSSRTCGRLGNFLFQFAATYSHAKKNGFDYCMPKRSINERLWPTPRLNNIKYCGPQPGKIYMEPSPAYSPIPNEDNIILEGYYQSEKYWHGFKKELAEVLEFEYKPSDYVSVHVRRGDYLQFADQFPVLPIEYYKIAIWHFGELGYKKFRVYSDDIRYCKSVFKLEYSSNDLEFEFSTGKSAIDDMRDMYNGAGLIIANSSFSLFPALLRTDNPIVIAPAEHRWFGPKNKHLNSPDRMAERFIKI